MFAIPYVNMYICMYLHICIHTPLLLSKLTETRSMVRWIVNKNYVQPKGKASRDPILTLDSFDMLHAYLSQTSEELAAHNWMRHIIISSTNY